MSAFISEIDANIVFFWDWRIYVTCCKNIVMQEKLLMFSHEFLSLNRNFVNYFWMLYKFRTFICAFMSYMSTILSRGVFRNFSKGGGGLLNFFVWTGKCRGFGIFFLENPSKLKKFPKGVDPQNPPWIRPWF